MPMHMIARCTDIPMAQVADLQDMTERGRQISYATARRHIGRDALAAAFPGYDWSRRPQGLTMRRDWHVEYYRSRFRGAPCIYVKWSAIEFVFSA